ncbi:hypothetical protein EVAR_80897_1 [Eumeta japonica]|uniref:Uncharacterized protein n=1 Tax=Eumeta variegata TaxID=151549 RepID=A0A4C1V0U4_EUMVA|nr:hypothetical protein EVAR_80897_1 [Eumeta japonica]
MPYATFCHVIPEYSPNTAHTGEPSGAISNFKDLRPTQPKHDYGERRSADRWALPVDRSHLTFYCYFENRLRLIEQRLQCQTFGGGALMNHRFATQVRPNKLLPADDTYSPKSRR